MADNLTIKDGNAVARMVRTSESGGVHTPVHHDADLAASIAPATSAVSVVPSDGIDLATPARLLYVGSGGNVSVQIGGTAVLFKNVPDGGMLPPMVVTRVNATGTSAANIIALF